MIAIRALFFCGAILSLVTALFTNPDPIIRSTFHVGESQTIRYNTTFTKYTIALWQQAPQGGAAKLGPILYRMFTPHCPSSVLLSTFSDNVALETTNGPQTNFDWLVQAYDFNIDDSNIFFFWLFEGDSSAQGNGSLPNSVSSYFVIAKAVTTSSALPSSTTSAFTSLTSSTTVSTTTSAQASRETSSGSGGLSTGASVGIGVGVGLGVVIIAAAVAFIFWKRRASNKVQQEQTAVLERREHDDKGAWQPHTPYTPYPAQMTSQSNTPYTPHSSQTAAPLYQQESYPSASPPSSTSPRNTSRIPPRYEASAEPSAVEIG